MVSPSLPQLTVAVPDVVETCRGICFGIRYVGQATVAREGVFGTDGAGTAGTVSIGVPEWTAPGATSAGATVTAMGADAAPVETTGPPVADDTAAVDPPAWQPAARQATSTAGTTNRRCMLLLTPIPLPSRSLSACSTEDLRT